MDIQKLLSIESEAQEAMNDMAKEELRIREKAKLDLQRRLAEIEAAGQRAIEKLRQDSEADCATKVAEIQAECQRKIQELQANFSEKRTEWRGKIFHDVLYG